MRFPFVTNQARLRDRTRLHERFQLSRDLRNQVLRFGKQPGTDDDDGGCVLGHGMAYGLTQLAPMGFQGFLDVTCDFENGHGFAYIAYTAAQELPARRRAISR